MNTLVAFIFSGFRTLIGRTGDSARFFNYALLGDRVDGTVNETSINTLLGESAVFETETQPVDTRRVLGITGAPANSELFQVSIILPPPPPDDPDADPLEAVQSMVLYYLNSTTFENEVALFFNDISALRTEGQDPRTRSEVLTFYVRLSPFNATFLSPIDLATEILIE